MSAHNDVTRVMTLNRNDDQEMVVTVIKVKKCSRSSKPINMVGDACNAILWSLTDLASLFLCTLITTILGTS